MELYNTNGRVINVLYKDRQRNVLHKSKVKYATAKQIIEKQELSFNGFNSY